MNQENGLKVYSIFESISGEVGFIPQGSFAVFVRFSGCNLQCSYCFGVKPGRRVPRILTLKGKNRRIDKIKEGDTLLTLDENLEIVETTVKKVFNRKVDSWMEIKINNKLYYVTHEHPFFTNRGLIRADELVIGDMILHTHSTDKSSYNMKNNNPMFDGAIKKKSIQNTDYKKVGKKISSTIKKKQKEGTYIKTWDLLSDEKKKESKRKNSLSKIGSKNPNWKGGSKTPNYDNLKKLIKEGKINKCSRDGCERQKFIEVHHKDEDRNNDSIENLEIICKSCHTSEHQKGYNFWKNGNRKDGKKLKGRNGFEVQKIREINRFNKPPSIRPSRLNVYNLSCSPHNTYIVDHMWVHNCDTHYAARNDNHFYLTIHQIIKAIKKFNSKNVIFTGGEPLLQEQKQFSLLCQILRGNGFNISIETNGSFRGDFGIISTMNWIFDYKLPSSGMADEMIDPLDILSRFYGYRAIHNNNVMYKFVISDKNDWHVASLMIQRIKNNLPHIFRHKDRFRFAVSPAVLKDTETDIGAQLIEWVKHDKLQNDLIYNMQIHKKIKGLQED